MTSDVRAFMGDYSTVGLDFNGCALGQNTTQEHRDAHTFGTWSTGTMRTLIMACKCKKKKVHLILGPP